MKFLLNYCKGILIGSGAILPGISSGVFCVIFGIYEDLVNSVLGLFKNFKTNFLFLLPFAVGGITGVFIVGKLLNFLLISYPMQCKFCFIGLICGSIPILCKQANNKCGFRLHYLFYFLLAFAIGILSIRLERILPNIIQSNFSTISFPYLVLAGFLMSVGIVVPGVSSTVILMCLGVYSHYLQAIASLNFTMLFPIGIGLIFGCIIFLKIIQYLLKNYYSQTFYGIIGFVLGSVFVLYPGFTFNIQGFLSICLFSIGFLIGLKCEKLDSTN